MKDYLIFAVVILAVLAFAGVCIAGIVYVVGEATCAERLSMLLVASGLVHAGMYGEVRARGNEVTGLQKAVRELHRELANRPKPQPLETEKSVETKTPSG